MEEPEWWGDEPDDDERWDRYHPGLVSQQFVVSDNPVVGVLYGPDGDEMFAYHERDDRFGFLKWAEDR